MFGRPRPENSSRWRDKTMKVGFFDTPAWGRIGMIIEGVSGDFYI